MITLSTNRIATFGELMAFAEHCSAVDSAERFDEPFGYTVYRRPNDSVVVAVWRLSDNNMVVVNLIWSAGVSPKVKPGLFQSIGFDVAYGLGAIVDGIDGPSDHYVLDLLGVKAALNDEVVDCFMNGYGVDAPM